MTTWLDTWIAERKRRGFTSMRENLSHYRTHVEPVLGGKHIAFWTADDLRALCKALDTKAREEGNISWKTAVNVWGTARKMCRDAMSSKVDALRVRGDNPVVGVEGPYRGERGSKQYLYPSEFMKLVSCEAIPMKWRRTAAVAVYLFARAGELRVLRWEDVDLEHGTVHIHRAMDRNTGAEKATKTGDIRRFNIEPTLIPLLRAMHEERSSPLVLDLPSKRDLARGLRRWLRRAGVQRAALLESTATGKALTFHDLRATGLTWLAVRDDAPLKIMQRAGHADFKTTQGYIREAEAVRDGFGQPFPPLPPDLLGEPASRPQTGGNGQGDGGVGIRPQPSRLGRRWGAWRTVRPIRPVLNAANLKGSGSDPSATSVFKSRPPRSK